MSAPVLNRALVSGQNFFLEVLLEGQLAMTSGPARNDYNIFHFFRSTVGSAANKTNIANAFQSAFLGDWFGLFPNSYELLNLDLRFLDTFTDAYALVAINQLGTVVTDRTTAFNAVFYQGDTGNRGRSWRAKKHIGPVPESFTTGDNLNSTGTTAHDLVKTALNGLTFMDGDGNVWSPIVVSQINSILGNEPARSISYAGIDSWDYSIVVGTMKHRKEKA